MFDIGLQEMVIIGVIALLVFGPSKLPELGRMVGRAMRELRRTSDEFRSTVESNLHINDPEPVIGGSPGPAPEPYVSETPAEVATTEAPQGEGESSASAALGEPYVAQRGARLYHRRECGWAKRIAEIDRIYLKRVAEARDQGFSECPVCEPWEPA